MVTAPTFPARPINGGPFDKAPPKFGKWVYELKLNGWRALVHAPTGIIYNRHLKLSSIPEKFEAALEELKQKAKKSGIEWWDCEALERRHDFARGTLVVLDAVVPDIAYEARQQILEDRFAPMPQDFKSNSLYRTTYSLDGIALWNQVPQINDKHPEFVEGVVAKRIDSDYPF